MGDICLCTWIVIVWLLSVSVAMLADLHVDAKYATLQCQCAVKGPTICGTHILELPAVPFATAATA